MKRKERKAKTLKPATDSSSVRLVQDLNQKLQFRKLAIGLLLESFEDCSRE